MTPPTGSWTTTWCNVIFDHGGESCLIGQEEVFFPPHKEGHKGRDKEQAMFFYLYLTHLSKILRTTT
jgi:hypothetical protein